MKLDIENATFICGHRKSGTTLLLSLLENHPELLVYPADSGFFNRYYPLFDTLPYTNTQKIERMALFVIGQLEREIQKLSEFDQEQLHFPIEALRHDFRQYAGNTRKTPKDMLISLIQTYQKHFKGSPNPSRWLEKSVYSEMYAANILEWFPNAKFIHVVRDPRDNWASIKSGWETQYCHFTESLDALMHEMIERGRLSLEFARNNQKRFGTEIYTIVKYEELTANPKQILHEICNFLDISFSETMLVPTVCGKLWEGNNFEGVKFDKPSAINTGRWPERITREEVGLLEYHFAALMEYFDYEMISSSLEERMDAATNHYMAYNAQHLLEQICPGVIQMAYQDGVIDSISYSK